MFARVHVNTPPLRLARSVSTWHGMITPKNLLSLQSSSTYQHGITQRRFAATTWNIMLQQPSRKVRTVTNRNFSTSPATRDRLLQLEQTANTRPDSAYEQTVFMRELIRAGHPELAIRRFESNRFARSSGTQAAYNDALSALRDPIPSLASSSSSSHPSSSFSMSNTGNNTTATLGSIFNSHGGSSSSYDAAAAAAAASASAGESRINPLYVTMVTDHSSRLASLIIQVAVSGVMLVVFMYVIESTRGGNGATGPNPFATAARSSYEVKPLSPSEQKTFKDVKGMDESKAELEEVVEFLKNPDKFTSLGGKLPRGILMTGAPGVGKTLLAKAVAGEAGVKFLSADGSSFEEMYVGVGARRVRDLFKEARANAPCVVFIDEIDAVGATRQLKEQQAMKMTLNQLLVEMDGFKSSEGIIVLAATNFPELLDSALTRPGRFDRVVAIPLPDVKGRREILEHYLKQVSTGPDVVVDTLARATTGMSGADLQNLVNVAAVTAATKNQKTITQKDFEHALDRVLMGVERVSAVVPEQVRLVTAYHEGGHALVALRTEGAMPVFKATIIPRGHALGMVQQLPTEVNMMQVSKTQLLATIDVCMAGRVAEELVFGANNVTSGASSDLVKATKIARDMVASYGMMQSTGVGLAVADPKTSSPETLRLIDMEIKTILDASYARVHGLLTAHKMELDRIARALLDKETLSVDELKKVAGL